MADGRVFEANGRVFESNGRPFVTDGRPFEADGRPFVADGRPFAVDGRPREGIILSSDALFYCLEENLTAFEIFACFAESGSVISVGRILISEQSIQNQKV